MVALTFQLVGIAVHLLIAQNVSDFNYFCHGKCWLAGNDAERHQHNESCFFLVYIDGIATR